MGLERFDDEEDVLIEIDGEVLCAAGDVFAFDGGGEACLFEFLFDAFGSETLESFGSNEGAGGDESGEFVAGVEGFVEEGDAGVLILEVVGVGEDGVDDLFGVASFAEDGGALEGVVRGIGPAFVVEVVEECDGAPEFFVFAEFTGVGADGGFDGEHVFDEAIVGDEFADESELRIAIGEGVRHGEKVPRRSEISDFWSS